MFSVPSWKIHRLHYIVRPKSYHLFRPKVPFSDPYYPTSRRRSVISHAQTSSVPSSLSCRRLGHHTDHQNSQSDRRETDESSASKPGQRARWPARALQRLYTVRRRQVWREHRHSRNHIVGVVKLAVDLRLIPLVKSIECVNRSRRSSSGSNRSQSYTVWIDGVRDDEGYLRIELIMPRVWLAGSSST